MVAASVLAALTHKVYVLGMNQPMTFTTQGASDRRINFPVSRLTI